MTLPQIRKPRQITEKLRTLNRALWDVAPQPKITMCERVRRVLVQRAGCWIPAIDLEVGGRHAWRSRVSELRQGGMTIENRQVRLANGSVRSEYKYIPGPEGT